VNEDDWRAFAFFEIMQSHAVDLYGFQRTCRFHVFGFLRQCDKCKRGRQKKHLNN
jgi:hypothetical protein